MRDSERTGAAERGSPARVMTRLALLTACALALHTLEAMIPPLTPVPGIKLGLANAVTLFTLLKYGRRDAALVLAARVLLGALFAGSVSSLIFSAAGGLVSFVVSSLLYRRLGTERAFVTGAVSAVAHGAAQIVMAVLVTQTDGLWIWLLPVTAAGIVTGAFTGFCAGYASRRIEE